MKNILDITLKDLLELTRNRMTFLFSLIMPIAFTILFGFAFSGVGDPPEDPRLPIGFMDQDGETISKELITLFEGSTVFRLAKDPETTRADLEKQVADGDLAAAIIIPAGYGKAAKSGKPLQLVTFFDPSTLSGMTIQSDILAAVNRLMNAVHTAKIVVGINPNAEFDTTLMESLNAWENPPVRVDDETPAPSQNDTGSQANSFTYTAPGMMLQFAIAGLLSAAQVMVNERKNRCLQRLLTTAASRMQILMGHYLAIVILLLGQFILLIVFGQLALNLDYFQELIATLLVVLTAALCIGGLGLLIGVLAKTDEQAIMFSLIPMFILSALGGAWVPLEITGPTFSAFGHISPVAWALDGFENIIARGLGFDSVILPAAALVGYAILFPQSIDLIGLR